MKTLLSVAVGLLLGFAAGYLVRDRAQPVGRYAFLSVHDATGAPLRLDTATGEIVLCMPNRFTRLNPEAYPAAPAR